MNATTTFQQRNANTLGDIATFLFVRQPVWSNWSYGNILNVVITANSKQLLYFTLTDWGDLASVCVCAESDEKNTVEILQFSGSVADLRKMLAEFWKVYPTVTFALFYRNKRKVKFNLKKL